MKNICLHKLRVSQRGLNLKRYLLVCRERQRNVFKGKTHVANACKGVGT